jgi:hypothetical protein
VQHLENTKLMLFNETSDDFEFNADRYCLPKIRSFTSIRRQRRKISVIFFQAAAPCPGPRVSKHI